MHYPRRVASSDQHDDWAWNDSSDVEGGQSRSSTIKYDDDDDLHRAITLSLQNKKETPPSSTHGSQNRRVKKSTASMKERLSSINHRSNSRGGSRKYCIHRLFCFLQLCDFLINSLTLSATATKDDDSWENKSGWESESDFNDSWAHSDSDSNLSKSSSFQQQVKFPTQNESPAPSTSWKAPAGINVTPSTKRKTSLLDATATTEGKTKTQTFGKPTLDNDDIFAAMGLTADIKNATSVRSNSDQSIKADAKKSSFGWKSTVLNNKHSTVHTKGVTTQPTTKYDNKSSWGDVDDELAALLDDD